MTNFVQKAKKNQKGFTLVELMVVVVIIGILVAIAVPVYQGTQKKAKINAHKANVRIIEGAMQVYFTENPGEDVEDFGDDLGEDSEIVPNYLKERPENPYKAGDVYEIKEGGTVDPAADAYDDE